MAASTLGGKGPLAWLAGPPAWLLWLASLAVASPPAPPPQLPPPRQADPVPQLPPPVPASRPVLTLGSAVQHALLNNPQLAAFRQQHGITAAGLVIAKTYPFNPLYQAFVWGDNGPFLALVTNHVFNEHTMRLDLELCGQGKHRRAAAGAALSRVDWDIAAQELAVAVGAIRAFNAVLYRDGKVRVLEETVRINERTVEQVRPLVQLGKLRPADLVLARAEVAASRAQVGQARTALAVGWADLRRSLGSLDLDLLVQGQLGDPPQPVPDGGLAEAALRLRPELKARRAAVEEAEARLGLERANRWGNPSLGPAFEYNETRVVFIGMWLVTPIPVLNIRCGEIQQRQAEVERAKLDLRQVEVQVQQDVQAALARLVDARAWADGYEKEVLPALARSREEMEKLFAQGDPSVDVLRLIEVQRRYLRALDSLLDARFEVSSAVADLAAAIGDLSVAVPCSPLAPTSPPPAQGSETQATPQAAR